MNAHIHISIHLFLFDTACPFWLISFTRGPMIPPTDLNSYIVCIYEYQHVYTNMYMFIMHLTRGWFFPPEDLNCIRKKIRYHELCIKTIIMNIYIRLYLYIHLRPYIKICIHVNIHICTFFLGDPQILSLSPRSPTVDLM